MRLPLRLLPALALLASCQFDPAVSASALVRCDGTGACPAGLVCRTSIGLCVPTAAQDVEAPSLVGPRLSPAVVRRGQPLRLTFTASEALGAAPVAVLTRGSQTLTMTADDAGTTASDFAFTYVPGDQDTEGPVTAAVSLIDASGNESPGLTAGASAFDFTPPRLVQATYVAPRSADGVALAVRSDEAIEVRLVVSEPVADGAALVALAQDCAGGAPSFAARSNVAGLLDFFAPPPSGTPGCLYTLRLSQLVDVAGNAAAPTELSVPASFRVLEAAPDLRQVETLRPADAGWVPAGVFSRAAGFERLGLRFEVGPTASAVSVLFDDLPLAGCGLANCAALARDAGFGCFCERPLGAADVEGLHAVQLSVRDGPGQTRAVSRPVRFDFSPPRLVPGTAHLLLTPPPAAPVSVVSGLGVGGTAKLLFSVDEPLDGLPSVACAPTPLAFALSSSSGTSYVYEHTLGAAVTSVGTQQLTATVQDTVGNAATLPLTDATFALDGQPPTLPATLDGGVVFRRVPWGDEQGAVRFSVRGAPGTAEPGVTVRALDGPSAATAVELGRAQVQPSGAFDLTLARSDRREVWLSLVDAAGNQSAAADVKHVEWVATLARRRAGSALENPNQLDTFASFSGTALLSGTAEVSTPALLAWWDDAGVQQAGLWRWQSKGPYALAPSGSGTLAFDERRGRVLWFEPGGARLFERADGPWQPVVPADPEGDGSPLALVIGSLPEPLAYDARRGVTVLLHEPAPGALETWEWNGSSWVQRAVSPPALLSPNMAYDARREVVVLFGRPDNASPGQIWEYDGGPWRRVTPTTTTVPPPRSDFSMTYDSLTQRILVFGGFGFGVGALADFWAWDGAQWTQLAVGASPRPTARISAGLAVDAARGKVVLFGGQTGAGNVNETWEWDGGAWQQRSLAVNPTVQVRPRLVADPLRGGVVQQGTAVDGWTFDGVAWRPIGRPSSPGNHVEHGLSAHAANGSLVLFGGSILTRADTWVRIDGGWVDLTDAGPGPSARRGMAMAYDPARGRTVLFGGADRGDGNFGLRADPATWEWDGARWSQVADAGPPERYGAAFAYDEAGQRLLLFGGAFANGTTVSLAAADLWAWDGASWAKVADGGAGAPAPRMWGHLAYDARRSRLVLFGGTVGAVLTTVTNAELWEFDGQRWEDRSDAGVRPPGRMRGTFTYDRARERCVLVGGNENSNVVNEQVWTWDGTAWRNETPATGPGPRYQSAAVYDEAAQAVTLVGGLVRVSTSTGQPMADTWMLGADPLARPAHVVRLSFGAADPEPGAVVTDVRARWVGGGSGDVGAGARLWAAWRGAFLPAALLPTATPSAPELVSWTTTDPALLAGLFAGPRSELQLALTPRGANGSGQAQVFTDWVEAVVAYRRP